MTSAIDPTKPIEGTPTTQSVRDNFAAAKSEIEGLQAAQVTQALYRGGEAWRRTPGEYTGQLWTPQTEYQPALTTLSITANTMRAIPFRAPRSGFLTGISFEVTTFAAGNAILGLYIVDNVNTGLPGQLLNYSAPISVAANGIKTWTLSRYLAEGYTYFVTIVNDIAFTGRALAAANCRQFWPAAAASFTAGRNMASVAFAYGNPPDPGSALAWVPAQATAPFIGLIL